MSLLLANIIDMRLSSKILLLTFSLLAFLSLNTYIGLRQLDNVQGEFVRVIHEDVALMEVLSATDRIQLERNILLEKLIAIAEETAFEKPNFARTQYLQDELQNIRTTLAHDSQSTAALMSQAKIIADGSQSWQELGHQLRNIEHTQRNYQDLLNHMLGSIEAGGFQLSIDDLYKFRSQEEALSNDLKTVLNQMQLRMHNSLDQARNWKYKAHDILLMCLFVSIGFSLLLAALIIMRIMSSLKQLTTAAEQVGQGEFAMDLDVRNKDEIADVARAFNTMSQQLKLSTAKLEDQNEDLKKVNQELDGFVHTVSHDILQPLTGVIGYSALLESNYSNGLDSKGKEAVAGIRRSATRIKDLLNDLLELTRISRIKNPYSEVAIKDIVVAALEASAFRIQERGARIDIEDLPSIVCDRIKMTLIFTNLIGNALKYAKPNQAPQIEIGYDFQGPCYEFYVKDHGIGIPLEHQPYIFDLFQRVPGREKYEGLGAGLAIVKAAVDSQGGKIRVASNPGEGSTFFFQIPTFKASSS